MQIQNIPDNWNTKRTSEQFQMNPLSHSSTGAIGVFTKDIGFELVMVISSILTTLKRKF